MSQQEAATAKKVAPTLDSKEAVGLNSQSLKESEAQKRSPLRKDATPTYDFAVDNVLKIISSNLALKEGLQRLLGKNGR